MSARTHRLLGRGAIRPGFRSRRTHLVEEPPTWVVLQPDPCTARRTGLFHLMRAAPAYTTVCGLQKQGWQRWPPASARPPVEMCCRRCMRIAMQKVLEGRYELR